MLCLVCSRVRCSLSIGSVTRCHSGLRHKCCQKTSAHQTQWVMTSGDGDRWARDMMMTLSAVWDHKKPHGSENSYQPILTANCPASSLCPKTPTGEWCTISFETGSWSNSLKIFIFSSLFLLQDWLHILMFFCKFVSSPVNVYFKVYEMF